MTLTMTFTVILTAVASTGHADGRTGLTVATAVMLHSNEYQQILPAHGVAH
jgi:hypothetical protein